MNLRALDLNLLVALDALLRERHVSRAAERVGLSQPAMSNALGRLRRLFGDDLLVRTSGGMQPTPRALELAAPLEALLRQVERLMQPQAAFDAERSDRRFALRLSDLLALLLLPALQAAVERQAPRASLDIVHLPPAATVDALERGEVDAAVSMGLEHGGAIRSRVLLRDRMVCVLRRGHPAAGEPLTLERFLALRHLKVSQSPSDRRFADDVLAPLKQERTVALNVPSWLVAGPVLAASDLVAVMPARLAEALAAGSLVVRELPLAAAAFDWRLYWHRRDDASPPNVWLRERLAEVAGSIG